RRHVSTFKTLSANRAEEQGAIWIVAASAGTMSHSSDYALLANRWLNGHNDVMPMFLSLNTVLGVFLLLAVKQPVKHRSLIAYGAWSSLAHGFTMSIQSAEAAAHGIHRNDSPWDIVIFGVIGVTLLALLPAKQPSPAAITEPRFAER